MKFSVSKEVIQMIEVLERSPSVRRLACLVVVVFSCYPLAALVKAVRWW